MKSPVKMLNLEDGLVDVSSSPTTLAATVGGAVVAMAGSGITLNLPALASVRDGKLLSIAIRTTTADVLTLDGNASETINGAATMTMQASGSQIASVLLMARTSGGGAGWWIVGAYLFP